MMKARNSLCSDIVSPSEIGISDIENLIVSLEMMDVRVQEKELLQNLKQHYCRASSDLWRTFYLRIPRINPERDFQKEKDGVKKPTEYEMIPYSIPRPLFEDIERDVVKESEQVVKTVKFWRLKALRDDYVGEHTFPRYQQAIRAWEEAKTTYEKRKRAELSQLYNQEKVKYDDAIREIETRERAYYHPSKTFVETGIKDALRSIVQPFAIAVAYSYSSRKVILDVLYPDKYEIIPSEFSSAPKTQSDENLRYVEVVLGCAYRIAARLFNVTFAIDTIVVVGHTEMFSIADAKVNDSTLFAVSFDRETFHRDFSSSKQFSPYMLLSHYLHIINTSFSSRYYLSPIMLDTKRGGGIYHYRKDAFSTLLIQPSQVLCEESKNHSYSLNDRLVELARYVVIMQRVSIPEIQRRLGISDVEVEHLLDRLESIKVVSSQNGSIPRRVLVHDLDSLKRFLVTKK